MRRRRETKMEEGEERRVNTVLTDLTRLRRSLAWLIAA